MSNRVNAEAGCLLVGEYVDEVELPKDHSVHRGEVVRPRVVADSTDYWRQNDTFKEYLVLLRDGRTVAVRGQGLKLLSTSETGSGVHYGVFARLGSEETFLALFKGEDVVGIFHGELRTERQIA